MNNVAGDLLNLDEKRTYKIRPDEMASILNRRLQLPEVIKSDPQHMQNFLSEYTDEGTINYKYLLEDLRAFTFKSDLPGNDATTTSGAHTSQLSTTIQPEPEPANPEQDFSIIKK